MKQQNFLGFAMFFLLFQVSVNVKAKAIIDTSKYAEARVFPGLVGETEPRLKKAKANINLNYTLVSRQDLKIRTAPGQFFSTGFYAPAGEEITVKVPKGVNGLKVQIGAHTDNLTRLAPEQRKRDPIINSVHELQEGENKVLNLYGGTVWIVAKEPLGKTITLTFSGVVKSPDFVLGQTTNSDWKKLIEKSTVPFFELRSKYIIFTLERSKLAKQALEDPEALMKEWDRLIYKDMYQWLGLTENNPDIRNRMPELPWRIVHDIKPVAGAQHAGYPVVATNAMSYFKQAVTKAELIGGNWGTWHEIGHNLEQLPAWIWPEMIDVYCNVFSLNVTHNAGYMHPRVGESMKKVIAFTSIADSTKAFSKTGLDVRLGIFAQIFERYGYDFMTYISKEARQADVNYRKSSDKIDFFYEKLSAFTKQDMKPFLNAYGIYPSQESLEKVALQYPLLKEEVWLLNPYVKKTF